MQIKCVSWLAWDSHGYLHNFAAADDNYDAQRAALGLDLAFDLPQWPSNPLRFCLFMGMAQPLAAVGQMQTHGRTRRI